MSEKKFLMRPETHDPRHKPGYSIKVYMDAVDFDEDAWELPTTIYPELIDFRKYGKNCVNKCGVYRLEMRVMEVLDGSQVGRVMERMRVGS